MNLLAHQLEPDLLFPYMAISLYVACQCFAIANTQI